jgi:NADPH:quinone reductase-like Zn-dependent oxidoreductase
LSIADVVRFHSTGGPEVLAIEKLEVGDPSPTEVKIRVEAIGLNRAEVAFRSGRYLEQPKLPCRLGYEGDGIVIAVGSAARGLAEGDHVSVIPTFSMNDYGTYGREILVPAAAVTTAPAGLDSVTRAALWMQTLTAYGALVEVCKLRAGDHVIIRAASSSVGLAAIQLAKLVGAVPIAATRTSNKRQALLDAGASHVIATEEQDLVAEVRKITAGAGARVVFDPVAGPYSETLAMAMATNGVCVIYGGLSGQATPFPARLAMSRALTFRGYTLFEITRDSNRLEPAKAFITAAVEAGKLKPIIDRTFPFHQIAEAHRYMERSAHFGKIVVTVP